MCWICSIIFVLVHHCVSGAGQKLLEFLRAEITLILSVVYVCNLTVSLTVNWVRPFVLSQYI